MNQQLKEYVKDIMVLDFIYDYPEIYYEATDNIGEPEFTANVLSYINEKSSDKETKKCPYNKVLVTLFLNKEHNKLVKFLIIETKKETIINILKTPSLLEK